jgi:hypothetical protein
MTLLLGKLLRASPKLIWIGVQLLLVLLFMQRGSAFFYQGF